MTFGGEEREEEWRMESGGVYASWNGVVAEGEEEEADVLWDAVANQAVKMSGG